MLNLSMFEIVTLSESLISTYNQHHPDDHRNHLKIVARSDLENFFSPSESSCITDASSRNRSPDVPLLHLLVATQEHFKFSLLEKGIDRSRDLANGATGEEAREANGKWTVSLDRPKIPRKDTVPPRFTWRPSIRFSVLMGWSHLSTSIDPSDTSPPALVLLLIRIHGSPRRF